MGKTSKGRGEEFGRVESKSNNNDLAGRGAITKAVRRDAGHNEGKPTGDMKGCNAVPKGSGGGSSTPSKSVGGGATRASSRDADGD